MNSASGNPNYARELLVELVRWSLLVVGAIWLVHPYFSEHLIGTGDAIWYHNLLADAVLQFRAGEFPVFVGQTDFMFNGAVYPHRVAPYHQYLGGLIDLLTGRQLSFLALQHLTIVVSFVGGAVGAYLALARLAPARRNEATLLALLYVACPGVAGLAFAQDLFMSVMTLPWVPLALGGAWLTFRENSWRALTQTALALAALWWAHAPIALWVSLVIALQQLVRLAIAERDCFALVPRGLVISAALLGAIAYPVVSAYLLRAPGESVVPYVMDRALLLAQIRDTFPASVLPLNAATAPLSQLQLGYGLALVLGATLVAALARRHLAAGFAALVALGLLILVLPVPGITTPVWQTLPETLVGLTLYWPMQRLYIVLAALVLIGAAAQLAVVPPTVKSARWFCGLLALALVWSAWEFRSLHTRAETSARQDDDPMRWGRTENATPMRHAYHLFPKQPPTMSHGVMDPEQESQLVDPANDLPLPVAASDGPWSTFVATPEANPAIFDLAPSFRLEPSRHYRLEFDFGASAPHGILQIRGPGFFREYALPSSGNPRAFGAGPEANRELSLWTTAAAPIEVHLRFIRTEPTPIGALAGGFARYRWREYDRARAPVQLEGLMPYVAIVRTVHPAVLRTPRMAVPGYLAQVDGKPTPWLTTSGGFVGVPVPAGEHRVQVSFPGPAGLRVAFWFSLLCGLGLLAISVCATVRYTTATPVLRWPVDRPS